MQIQPNTDYQIVNANSLKSWAVSGNRATDRNYLVQYDVNNGNNQLFQFVPTGQPDEFYIVTSPGFGNFSVGLLFPYGAEELPGFNMFNGGSYFGKQPGSGVKITNNVLDTQQGWIIRSTNGGKSYSIEYSGSNLYVDVKDDSSDNDAFIIVYDQNFLQDQQWLIQEPQINNF